MKLFCKKKNYRKPVGNLIINLASNNIPIFSNIVSVVEFANSVHKANFLNKMERCLKQIDTVPNEQQMAFLDKINNSKKYSVKVGNAVFDILDKIDTEEKPEIIGKLFKATIENQISYDDFLRIAHIVINVFYQDLVWLKENTKDNAVEIQKLPSNTLLIIGLIHQDFSKIYLHQRDEIVKSKLTDIGEKLLKYGMYDDI